MKPSFEEDFEITHLEFYSLVVRASENEHDIHPIQSKKFFDLTQNLWLIPWSDEKWFQWFQQARLWPQQLFDVFFC